MIPPVNEAGLRILVADSNPDCAESLAILLRLYGHTVETALDGPAALKKAKDDEPDVVLLELRLPGMTGYDVARHLRANRTSKTPLLIAVTTYARDQDRQRSAEAGVDLHMVKPVDPDHLQSVLAKFQKALAGRSGDE